MQAYTIIHKIQGSYLFFVFFLSTQNEERGYSFMVSSHLKLASLLLGKNKPNIFLIRELVKTATQSWGKKAVFEDLSRGINKKESLPFFYYTAWAALFAKGKIGLEPSDSTLPSNFRDLRNQLRRNEPEVHKKIMDSWEAEGGAEWSILLQKLKMTFTGNFVDLGTDLFARYFLTSHKQNKSTPEASKSSAGKMQNELNGGVWYRLNKDPSRFETIEEAIKYIGNYIKKIYDPKSTHFTKREIIPGELKERRHVVDLGAYTEDDKNILENLEDKGSTSVLDEMEIENGIDPVKAQKQIENMISRALEGKVLNPDKVYNLSKETVEAKKDLFFLSSSVWKMLDEDWAMVIAKRWDETIVRDIMMTCSEVSSFKLAPMMIKRYKFMNIEQLKTFSTFVDECIDTDAVIFNPKVKVQVKKGKALFTKKMRRKSKSVPQWVNLFLAVNGGFTYQGIKIEGDLHGSAKKWGTAMIEIAENSNDPIDYFSALWSACNQCLPVKTMALNKSSFVETMKKFTDLYLKIREDKTREGGTIRLSVISDLYKERIGSFFKDSEKNYPQSLIAIPMAEGVRMSLILAVLPETFKDQLTTKNYISCADTLNKLFDIPQKVINAVQQLSSEIIVDDIIDIVEEEVKKSKPIPVSKQGMKR